MKLPGFFRRRNARKLLKSGIRRRWILNSLSAAVLLVAISLSVLSVFVSTSYYASVRMYLESRAENNVNFIQAQHAQDADALRRSAEQIIDVFHGKEKVEMQFITPDGIVAISSGRGAPAGQTISALDVQDALKDGKIHNWIGPNEETGERVMAVSAALHAYANRPVGVLRVVTSLEDTDAEVFWVLALVGFGSLAVVVLLIFTNTIFIRSILIPLQEINETAKDIGQGKYGARINRIYNDEIGELAVSINNMSGEIQAAERMKSDFIATVSHELRTPLTAISGWGETLTEEGLDDPEMMKKGIRVMLSETKRLTKMVEELLDFSRIDGGRLSLYLEPIRLDEELETHIFLHTDGLEREGIFFSYRRLTEIPVISGDPERLRQVFLNLLDNARKHGGDGKRIDFILYCEEETSEVVVEVRDRGKGILPEDLPHVKYKFYKGASSTRGSGIGLAVCDEIVRLHGGTLTVESVYGKGTTVTVRLPV